MLFKKQEAEFTGEYIMNIGKNIAVLRKKNNLTQEELAGKLGVSAQAISKWENDNSCPDISLLPKIADVFGVTVDDLIRKNDFDIISEKSADIEKHFQNSYISKNSKIIITIKQNNGKTNKVQLPFALIKTGLKIGNQFGLDKAVSSKINEIINSEELGEIITADTETGEHITIKIE